MAETGEIMVRVHVDTMRMAKAFEAVAIASFAMGGRARELRLWYLNQWCEYRALEAEQLRAEREMAAAFDRWWSAGEMAEEIIGFIEDHAARSAEERRAHRQIEAAYFAWSAGL